MSAITRLLAMYNLTIVILKAFIVIRIYIFSNRLATLWNRDTPRGRDHQL